MNWYSHLVRVHSSMCSSSKYLLNAYIVPGSVLRAEDTRVNKIDDSSYLPGAALLVGVDLEYE